MSAEDLIKVYTLGILEHSTTGPTRVIEAGVIFVHHDLDVIKEVILESKHESETPCFYIQVETVECHKYIVSNQLNLSMDECISLAKEHGYDIFTFAKLEAEQVAHKSPSRSCDKNVCSCPHCRTTFS